MTTGNRHERPPEIRRIDPREALREAIEADGSASAAARRLGCSASYLIDVRHGRRPASKRLLGALGLRRIVVEAARV
ncbi:hypothetical protein SAMN04487845_1751 [Methylobacterium sp. yr668]|nr:hypothetical protein SAMN04487845_1751 [Methylobacterium sp. yr668]